MDRHNEADCAKTLKKEQMASLQNNRTMAPRESTAGQSLSGKKTRCSFQPRVPQNTSGNSRTLNLGAAAH